MDYSKEPVIIDVNHVEKKFRVYLDKGSTLKEKVLFRSRRKYEDRWVLKGISFQVHRGEAIGLIGHNGCGKSTTLKLLTRIMYPDKGSITMKGRVSSLIELGAGFHPDMSGRENIYINASIFGLTRREIDRRLNDIIEFSELEDYIDNPVRTYSSGMYMRLAFAVAINVDADILLIDEILAVGDSAFQAKCFNRMREIKASGVTIVLVSHSLGQVEQICDRSIWINDGVIEQEGKPYDVHPLYMEYMGRQEAEHSKKPPEAPKPAPQEKEDSEQKTEEVPQEEAKPKADTEFRWGSREAEITGVRLLDEDGKDNTVFKTGKPMTIEINYKSNGTIKEAVFGIGIFRNDGLQVYGVNTNIDRLGAIVLPEKGTVKFEIKENNLIAGDYWLDVAIHKEDGFSFDYWKRSLTFRTYSPIGDVGVARLDHQWKIDGETVL